MTVEIKRVLLEKAKICRKYVKNHRTDIDRKCLYDIKSKCKNLISSAKESYYLSLGAKLCHPNIGQKRYWSIIHQFLNKRKIPKIPPLLDSYSLLLML